MPEAVISNTNTQDSKAERKAKRKMEKANAKLEKKKANGGESVEKVAVKVAEKVVEKAAPEKVPKKEEQEKSDKEARRAAKKAKKAAKKEEEKKAMKDETKKEEAKKEVLKTEDKKEKKEVKKEDAKETKKEDTKKESLKRSAEDALEQQPNTKKTKPTMSRAEVDAWRTKSNLTVKNVDDNSDNFCPPFSQFSDAPFPGFIDESVKAFKFSAPTPIQAQSWPLILQGRDIVGIAETGSGKTLAFGYPAIMHIKEKHKAVPGPKVMVLAPTRELAQQIHEVLDKACKPANLNTCCVFGGVSKTEQTSVVKKADIIVATPGRLIDLIEDGSAVMSRVDYVVFDEADRMLDMGFVPQIKRIINVLPDASKRQTVMFSATWPADVQKFAQTYLRNPIQITIGGTSLTGAKKVTQIVEVCNRPDEKKYRLKKLLNTLCAEGTPRILVFMLYKHTCNSLYEELRAEKWNVDCLHGDKNQTARNAAVANFKSGKTHILIATDVAARGLDIKDIKYVINVELPLVMEDYVHRIGRTGRAGESGSAYTIFCPDDKQHARQLVRILEDSGQKVPAELSKIAENAPVTKPRKTAMEQLYGDFAKGVDTEFMMKKPTRITFD